MQSPSAISYSQQSIGFKQKPLLTLCFMLFFWTMFDGVVSYITPLALSQQELSKTMVGVILGTSSIAGAAFDFFLCKFLSNTHFRRVYLFMFALCALYPVILFHAHAIWLFIFAMAIWGFYYDLLSFGSFDFVGRTIEPSKHTSSFGTMNVFKALGYMIAPLLAGLVLGNSEIIGTKPYMLIAIFLGISFVFYLIMSSVTKKEKEIYMTNAVCRRLNVLVEVHLWEKIGKILLPVLTLTTFFNIFDSFFWTLGPLLSESYTALHPFNGLFLTAYTMPTLFVGMFVGLIARRFGKKRTAFVSFLAGSLVLSLFVFFHSPILILADIFLASIFVSCTLPALNGAYADYLEESSSMEKEIEALGDFSSNLGYAVGPILAGVLADLLGTAQTFSVLGVICAAVAVILLIVTPKKIHVPVNI